MAELVVATEQRLSTRVFSLEPNDIREAYELCKMAVASGYFKHIEYPEQALMIVMRGRELGLTSMQALSVIYVIQGKTVLAAELIIALAKQAQNCKFFRLVKSNAVEAIWETQTKEDPEPTCLGFSMEDAIALGLSNKDNWKKQPKTMLRWRAGVALAKTVYPEKTIGLQAKEDFAEDELVNDKPPTANAVTANVVPIAPAAPSLTNIREEWSSKIKTCNTLQELNTLAETMMDVEMTGRLRKELGEAWAKQAKFVKEARKAAPKNGEQQAVTTEESQVERQPGEEG